MRTLHHILRVLACMFWLLPTAAFAIAPATLHMELASGSGQMGIQDMTTGVFSRSDTTIDVVNVPNGDFPPSHLLYILPGNDTPDSVTFHCRLDMAADCYRIGSGSTPSTWIQASGTYNSNDATITFTDYDVDADADDGVDSGWVEFDYTLNRVTWAVYDDPVMGQVTPIPSIAFWFYLLRDPNDFSAVFGLHFQGYGLDRVVLEDGGEQGNDRFYFVRRYDWKPDIQDGQVLPKDPSAVLALLPVQGLGVDFSGEGVWFDPPSGTSDSNGRVGTWACVDTGEFFGGNRGARGEPAAPATRQISAKYQKLARSKGISGAYCILTYLRGHAYVNQDHDAVMGEILKPGDVLDLRASVGEITQIGLKFVDGSKGLISGMAFTNACDYTTIRIGEVGFTDQSLITGKSWLASASTYLCEKVGDIPNTPDEWANATGEVIITEGASILVPELKYGTCVIEYVVKNVAGTIYRKVVKTGQPTSTPRVARNAVPVRSDTRIYYDGSLRVACDHGNVDVYESGTTPTLQLSVPAGSWREFLPNGTPGREWQETAASSDKQAPDFTVSWNIRYSGDGAIEVVAGDTSDLDESSFHATINGQDANALCPRVGEGHWYGDGIFPAFGSDVVAVTLSDYSGNSRTVTWKYADAPLPPTGLAITAASANVPTLISYHEPANASAAQIVGYEARQVGGGITAGPWYGLGRATSGKVPVAPGTISAIGYAIEVRSINAAGLTSLPVRSSTVNYQALPTPEAIAQCVAGRYLLNAQQFTQSDRNADTVLDAADCVRRAIGGRPAGRGIARPCR